MGFKTLFFGENWVGSKVAGMKTSLTHALAPKGPNKEFLKKHFS